MKMMIIGIIIVITALILFGFLIRKIVMSKNGKGKVTREKFAMQCMAMLIGLTADAIAAISSSSSFFDVLLVILGINIETSDTVVIATAVLSGVLLTSLFCLFYMTYIHWTGPVSKRQHRIDIGESEEVTGLWKDILVVCQSLGKTNLDLKAYEPHVNEEAEQISMAVSEFPWRKEFARMYRIITNQSGIDEEKDWHREQKCYISRYAQCDRIAALCVERAPGQVEVEEFLEYIGHFHQDYFRVIVAVREGEVADYTENINGYKVQYMFKSNMLEQLIDFSEYKRAIDKLYHARLTERSELRMEDIYVEPYAEKKDGTDRFLLKDYVNNWMAEQSNRQLALLGDFGQGKTLFTIHLTYHLLQEKKQHSGGRIPILIPLRGKSPRNSSPEEILSYFGVQYGIHAEALSILNANGRLLILFDGFDEMDLIGNDDIRRQHFKSLWSLVKMGKSKIIITGRPNYFMDQDEMIAALDIQSDTKELPYCQRIYLNLFDAKQISFALRSAPESVQEGIKRIVEKKISASFLDLIRRPSQLFLVSLIWEERKLEQRYANLTSAMIIDEFLKWSFERQASKSGEKNYCYLSALEREYFMTGIAVRMRKMGSTVIPYELFQEMVEELIAIFPNKLSKKNTYYQDIRNGRSIQEFANEDPNSARAIINDVRACGVLVNDYANEGLTFAHKSFYDLLVAKYFFGKYYRKQDEYMIIASALSRTTQYNLRIPKDLVIRKLLAELITMNIQVKAQNQQAVCEKIFCQCRDSIINIPIRFTKKRLLHMCGEERLEQTIQKVNGSREKERKRFAYIMCIIPIAMIGYLLQNIYYSIRYEQEAILYDLQMRGWNVASVNGKIKTNNHYIMIGVLVIVMVVLIFIIVNMITTMYLSSAAEIVLLTWYFTCKDYGIPDNVIRKNFSKKDWHQFQINIIDGNLNRLE